jgi:Arc/MetJ-type ribon-helix-helix transcriptional regulator
MKLSVSLPDEDVEFLDSYAQARGVGTRSAAVQQAVRLLRAAELGDDYEAAWAEWDSEGAEDDWSVTSGDGVG